MTKHGLESVIQHFRFWISPKFPSDFKTWHRMPLLPVGKNALSLKCGEGSSCSYAAEPKPPKTRIIFKTSLIFCRDVTSWWILGWKHCTLKVINSRWCWVQDTNRGLKLSSVWLAPSSRGCTAASLCTAVRGKHSEWQAHGTKSALLAGLQVGRSIWSDYFRCSTAGSVLEQKQYLDSFLCKKRWNFLMINHWKVKVWVVKFRGWPCIRKNTSCFFKTVVSRCTQTSYSKISCVINTVYYYY